MTHLQAGFLAYDVRIYKPSLDRTPIFCLPASMKPWRNHPGSTSIVDYSCGYSFGITLPFSGIRVPNSLNRRTVGSL